MTSATAAQRFEQLPPAVTEHFRQWTGTETPVVIGLFVPGTGWKTVPVDQTVEYTPDVARGARLAGVTGMSLQAGVIAGAFDITELV